MKKHCIFLILILAICIKSFGQQENLYYKKGIEIVLDSLIQEIPKVKFFLTSEYTVMDTSKDPFGGFNCNINFDNFKQNSLNSTTVIIPSKYQDRLKKNTFFNKLIYGNKLVEVKIDVLYEDSNNVLFVANIYGKEGGIFMFVQFKINSLDVNEFCKVYSIY
ncbi:hypothetical protein MH928_02705 [Flavobacterium sp. WW92]|uniref:hypothetical protein n=1 Tax=unclassified Flavobacterium TaxID=196869 RepID=UPI0022243B63|nr:MULTISPECIES: hypothetical protein [unclassified Flavobacterium]WDO13620.1 hypothetical protein MH928_02705 [Flavobacterium sp. WW92]